MLTKEAARTMLTNMAAEADEETFYSGIFTIVKEGVEGVTGKEISAFTAALATRVQVERIGKLLPGGSIEKFVKRFRVLAGIVKEMRDGAAPAATQESASPAEAPTASSGGGAPSDDADLEARFQRAVSRGPVPDDMVVGSGGPPPQAFAAPSSPPDAETYQAQAAAFLKSKGAGAAVPTEVAAPPAAAPEAVVAAPPAPPVAPPPAAAPKDGKAARPRA